MLRLLLTSIGATALVLPRHHRTLRSPRLATSNSNDEPTFASLAQLEARLSVLADGTSSKLRNYHDPTLSSFLLEAGVTTNYSVTSSAICVETLLASGDAAALEEFQLFGPTCDALANAKWRPDDFLQAPLVVLALARLAGRDERSREVLAEYAVRDRVRGAVQSLLERRPRLRDWRKQRLSSYIAYYLTAALLEVVDGAHDAGDGYGDDGEFRLLALLGVDRQDVGKALARSFAVARDELCRQLAAHAAGDASAFDVVRLAYSLSTYVAVADARETVARLGNDDIVVEEPNRKLCAAALRAFFREQRDDGTWPPGQAIFLRSRRSFDVGNAYVFFVDVLATVLGCGLPHALFLPYTSEVARTTTWLETHDVDGRGWRSDRLAPGGPPLAWCTAQALRCASSSLRVVRSLLNDHVLDEFGGRGPTAPDGAGFERLLDSDMSSGLSLKGVVRDRVIAPRLGGPGCEAWSAVLFGPPGTAKTTTAECVAKALGFGFVVVDTACFLEDGISNIASRIGYVFDRLKKLERVVILFDEIEEFCLDRNTPGIGMESRVLTTAMLTQINDLRRAERSVFLIATNRLNAFDSAIVRPGRLDLLLFIGTPSRPARVARFEESLAALCPGRDNEADAATFASFLEAHWDETAMFLNFMESERLKSNAVAAVRDGAALDDALLAGLLDDAAATMVLRDDAARDEYRANLKLTRL